MLLPWNIFDPKHFFPVYVFAKPHIAKLENVNITIWVMLQPRTKCMTGGKVCDFLKSCNYFLHTNPIEGLFGKPS